MPKVKDTVSLVGQVFGILESSRQNSQGGAQVGK